MVSRGPSWLWVHLPITSIASGFHTIFAGSWVALCGHASLGRDRSGCGLVFLSRTFTSPQPVSDRDRLVVVLNALHKFVAARPSH